MYRPEGPQFFLHRILVAHCQTRRVRSLIAEAQVPTVLVIHNSTVATKPYIATLKGDENVKLGEPLRDRGVGIIQHRTKAWLLGSKRRHLRCASCNGKPLNAWQELQEPASDPGERASLLTLSDATGHDLGLFGMRWVCGSSQ